MTNDTPEGAGAQPGILARLHTALLRQNGGTVKAALPALAGAAPAALSLLAGASSATGYAVSALTLAALSGGARASGRLPTFAPLTAIATAGAGAVSAMTGMAIAGGSVVLGTLSAVASAGLVWAGTAVAAQGNEKNRRNPVHILAGGLAGVFLGAAMNFAAAPADTSHGTGHQKHVKHTLLKTSATLQQPGGDLVRVFSAAETAAFRPLTLTVRNAPPPAPARTFS